MNNVISMSHTENLKKRISYTLLCMLFGFSLGVIFLSGIVNMKNNESGSKNAANIERQEKALSDSRSNEDCIVTDNQAIRDNSENDTLFIGCNGFF
jgi:hypothetical protein